MHSSKYAAQNGSTSAAEAHQLPRVLRACRRRGCPPGRNGRRPRRNPRRGPGRAWPGSTAAPARFPATPAPRRSGPGCGPRSALPQAPHPVGEIEVGGVAADELHVRGALRGVAEPRQPRRVDDERHRGETPRDGPLDDALEIVDAVFDVVRAGAHVDAMSFPDVHWSIAGAVSLSATRSQHLLSNCACGFPAHSLPMSYSDTAYAVQPPSGTSPYPATDAGPFPHAGVLGASDQSGSAFAAHLVATAIEARGHTRSHQSCRTLYPRCPSESSCPILAEQGSVALSVPLCSAIALLARRSSHAHVLGFASSPSATASAAQSASVGCVGCSSASSPSIQET